MADRFHREVALWDKIGEWWENAGNQYQSLAQESQITLTQDISPNLPPLHTTPWAMQTIADAILSNAIKFTSYRPNQSGEVHLSVKADQNYLLFQVTDNGIGISSEALPLIFQLFYQQQREQYEQQGAGLGLTIAQGIIDLHNGHIEVKSQENQSTTVTISLPYKPVETKSTSTDKPPVKRDISILIVEDEADLRLALNDLLSLAQHPSYKFHPTSAEDGVEAFTTLREKDTRHHYF